MTGRGERSGEAGHQRRHRGRGLVVAQQHGELVTAVAGEDVALADASLEPGRDLLQHPVADRVAVAVVDLLEPVEVAEQHHDVAGGAGSLAARGGVAITSPTASTNARRL